MKCPNCMAQFEPEIFKGKALCPYCDSKFSFKSETQKTTSNGSVNNSTQKSTENAKGQTLAQKLFNCTEQLSATGIEMYSDICAFINGEQNTFEEYVRAFNIMAKDSKWMATAQHNSDYFRTLQQVFRLNFEAGEELIFYKDSGLISRFKEGLLITNKRLFFLNKKETTTLRLADVRSINKDWLGHIWSINNKWGVDSINCTKERLSLILAFICSLARDANPQGYKIEVRMWYADGK